MNIFTEKQTGNVYRVLVDEFPNLHRVPGMPWTGCQIDHQHTLPEIPNGAAVHLDGRATEDAFRALSRAFIHRSAWAIIWTKDLWDFVVYSRDPGTPVCHDAALLEVICDRVQQFNATDYGYPSGGEFIEIDCNGKTMVGGGGRSSQHSQMVVESLNAWFRLMRDINPQYPIKRARFADLVAA